MDATSTKRLIEKVSLFVLVLWISILAVRVLLAPIDLGLLRATIICLIFFAGSYVLVIQLSNIIISGSIMLGVSGVSLLTLAWLSGGSASPVLYLFPIVPLVSALLFGRFFAWIICFVMSLAAIGFYLATLNIYSANIDVYTTELEMQTRLTTLWVVFATSASTIIANFFYGENQRLNFALHNQARLDFLTGLPNKRAIEERLTREVALSRRTQGWISIIMMDMDYFKRYNDAYGHAKGDECLKLIADTLKKSLRRADDFIGRYGGEEFIALLPDTNPDACRKIAIHMRKSVEELYSARDGKLQSPVTITLGCYSTRSLDNLNTEELVSQADKALYEGKRLGRNRVVSVTDKDELETLDSGEDSVQNILESVDRRQGSVETLQDAVAKMSSRRLRRESDS